MRSPFTEFNTPTKDAINNTSFEEPEPNSPFVDGYDREDHHTQPGYHHKEEFSYEDQNFEEENVTEEEAVQDQFSIEFDKAENEYGTLENEFPDIYPAKQGISPFALQSKKQWSRSSNELRPAGWRGKVYGLVVHTSGGSLPGKSISSKKYPTVGAIDYYSQSTGCNYINGWKGIAGGDLVQVANEDKMAYGVGMGEQATSIKNGRFEKDLPAAVVDLWKKRWPGYKNPMDLLPKTKTANSCYLHIECLPVVYYLNGKAVIDKVNPPMRPGLRFSKAQHDSIAVLAYDIASRNGWPMNEKWWRTPRLLGHEDLTPYNRHDCSLNRAACSKLSPAVYNKKECWDPGGLRSNPYIDWEYIYRQIEVIHNSGYEAVLNSRIKIAPELKSAIHSYSSLFEEEAATMDENTFYDESLDESESHEGIHKHEIETVEFEDEDLYNDETGKGKVFEDEYESFDLKQEAVVQNPYEMFLTNSQTPEQPVIIAQAESIPEFSNEKHTYYKMYDKLNKKFIGKCYDEQGNEISQSDIQRKENEVPDNVNNKIHPTLLTQILKVAETGSIDIAVWLNIEVKEPLKTNYLPQQLATMPPEIADHRRKLAATIGGTARRVTIERSGIQVQRVSDLLPLFFAKATKRTIDLIKNDPLVLAVFFNDKSYHDSLSTSMSKSGAAEAQTAGMTNLGKDIKVAVWERAPDLLTNLTIEGYYNPATPAVTDHSRLVCAVIKNKEAGKSKGYAPNCKLYSANADSYSTSDIIAPLEWAVKQGCTVINRSFHQDTDVVHAGLQLSDFITDALALRYPYPMIVQAAGNNGGDGIIPPENEYVNHKGYNSIAVGSHDEQAQRKISAFSTFRNPASPHNDRELPEICALGENISAVGLEKAGTSFASPAVAGSVAILQSISPTIKFYPEVARALLLTGSKRNVDGGLWYEDLKRTPKVDQKDGTGALNIYESITIAKKPYQPKNIALDKGWDYGKFDATSFGPDKISLRQWKIIVPRDKKHVKITLAWNSNANYAELWGFKFGISTLDIDLDILIYDDKNSLVATSSSFDNSFEIADYIAQAGQTLTVKVRGYSIKPSAWTYFGIAWTTFNG